MAEPTASLETTLYEYDLVRGDSADGVWAFNVARRLAQRDVDVAAACTGLGEDLEIVRQAGQPPVELFGHPQTHADELYDRWVSEGRLVLTSEPLVGWREVPPTGLFTAAIVALCATVVLLIDGSAVTWTAGLALSPAGVGLGSSASMATWHTLRSRRGPALAAGGALAVVIAMSTLLAIVWTIGNDHALGTAGSWPMLLIAAACLLLSVLLGRRAGVRAAAVGSVEEDWVTQLSRLLRIRADLPESRVDQVIAEARAHAQEAGSSLKDEFGSPAVYAAAFPPDLSAPRRRLALAYGALGAVATVLAVTDGWSWPTGLLAAILFAQAAVECMRAARTGRR